VNCANCGTANDEGAKFCNECGSPLQAGCPNCGAANKPGAKFCNECGASLGATPARAAPAVSTPVAERRLVTVLFADIAGFTPFAEERDSEEVRDALSRYFDLAGEIIGRYGGTVEKFIGDAVMAVWGAPTAHEDDAERAVRAALELVEAVPTLGTGISARAGVLTGEAAVTLGATNQGMVAGDLVNTASRLQSIAPPGAVLVGEATQRATSGAIAYEKAGEQALKGKRSPVPAWRALRVVAERGGRNRAEVLEAPFVGRTDEMRLLKELFHATGRENRARLVSVMGPAGIGKSRLAWEFSKYSDGLVENVYWHRGRCPAYGEGITFWALGEMVRARCGLLEADGEETTRAKVKASVEQWVADADEREWVEPALLTLLGIDAGAPSEQLFGAWRTFFERIAQQGTVAVVFEDMHFADSGLLDFIDHLLEWARSSAIYIVTLARPELLEKRPDWGAGKRSFVSLYLEPLPAGQMRELLAGLVPGLPDAAAQAIVERADGIPLYAVETVRMLLADGRLKEDNGVYLPVGDLTTLAVPETLTALIASRLDSLEPADRSLVHDAAVLGQSFTTSGLAAVSGLDEKDVEARLDGLVRRELLTRDLDARSAEHGQYAFVQALIREVAYNTISKKDRKVLHLAAARYFESLGTDELAGALASHYLAAHANATDEAETNALAAQARIALRGAAERAANLGAYDQAVTFYEQALGITIDPRDQAELLERAGDAARTAAKYEQAARLLERAVELRRGQADRVATAHSIAQLGEALNDGFRDDLAYELLDAAASEFADLAPDPVIADVGVQLARACTQKNDFQRALAVAEAVLETAETRDLTRIVTSALIVKGGSLAHFGRKLEGVALIEAAERIAREHGDYENVLRSLIVGGFHKGDTDLQSALQSYLDGAALARRIGHRGRLLALINNLGYVGFLVGDWDDALKEMEAALSDELDAKDRISIMSNAAIVHAARGEPIDETLHDAKRLGEAFPGEAWQTTMCDPEGNRALAQGSPAEASRFWRRLVELDPGQASEFMYRAAVADMWAGDREGAARALDAMEATGVHGRVATARRLSVVAGLAAFDGRAAEALPLYADALAAWRELRVGWDATLTAMTMARLLDPALPEVRRAAGEAREFLVRVRAQPFIEQLDAAVGRTAPAAPGRRSPEDTPATVRAGAVGP
jgi:class 3 adenylate cyclase/tetratricopeptide (TPR) repeat protein